MVCEHLSQLELDLIKAGIRETARGAVWSKNCREWVYFDCRLDIPSSKQTYAFDDCVQVHVNDDPRSGREAGLVCTICHDAVIGLHELDSNGKPVFPSPSPSA